MAIMTTVQSAELKQIVHEVIGPIASNLLLNRVCSVMDEMNKDPESLQQACVKVEKMVHLFIGPDQAQNLGGRFRESLRRAGYIRA